MRPINLRHFVFVEEAIDNVCAEHVAGASGAEGEAGVVGVGVAPHQIGKGPFMGDLLEPLDLLDVLYVLEGGGEAGMDAEDGVVDDGGDGEEVEQVREVLPHRRRPILPLAFRVEAVDLGDLSGFVVASEQSDPLGVAEFEEHEVGHGLHAESAPIHVVPQEEVVRVGDLPSHPEQLHQVVELPMHVPHHRHWRWHQFDVVFGLEDFFDLGADELDGDLVEDLPLPSLLQEPVHIK
mmetsp:Transcript_36448/g.35301  ORF Transcript_36448/g.35301 Transcript_36448/m.35301 type:complete len:236 (+) Transcript_36448:293-1000(+)